MSAEKTLRLIILNGSIDDAEALANTCRNAGLATRYKHVQGADAMQPLMNSAAQDWDLVLAQSYDDIDLAQALLKRSGKDLPLIVVTEAPDEASTLEALASGVRDVVALQPKERFLHMLTRELGDLESRRAGRRWERQAHECEDRARSLLDSSRDAIAYIHEGMHIYANPVYLELFGFDSADDIQGMPILDMISPEDIPAFKELLRGCTQGGRGSTSAQSGAQNRAQIRALRAGGEEFRTSMELRPASMGGETCIQITLHQEVTDRQLQEELARLSTQDLLTGLYNRQRFLQSLEQTVERATQGAGDSTLLYVEIDDFKAIKDNVGISATDALLTDLAALLRQQAESTDVLARFGEETFALLLVSDDLEGAKARAERIRQAVEEHVSEVDGQTVITTCSIGVCLVSAHFHNVQEALRGAETACTEAKRASGNRVKTYQASVQEYTEEKQWPKRIQEALAQDRFRLFFQPIVSLHGEPREMYQVLIRMLDEQGNIIPPRQFLSAAVKSELMLAIDRWIIARAVTTLAEHRRPDKQTYFFIKLSDQAIKDTSLAAWIGEKIRESRLASNILIFEIDEASALLHLNAARSFVRMIRELACQFSLAHFGAGTNPFSILKHLDVDYLWIDGSLIKSLDREAKHQITVSSLVESANSMGKRVIAENVEDANSLALLWQYGVHYALGHYIQEPSPTLDFEFSPSL